MTTLLNKHKQKPTRPNLRKNATPHEKILWQELKNRQLGVKFRRQYGIGSYVVDFCCPRKRLVVEVDGSVHQEKVQVEYDKDRDQRLKDWGFKVMRFSNDQVEEDLEGVVEEIKRALVSPQDPPSPPSQGGNEFFFAERKKCSLRQR